MSNIYKQIINYQYGNDDNQNKLFPIPKYPYLQYNNNANYNIQLSNPSSFLTKAHLISLENNLPSYEQYKDMKLLYTLTKDGASLRTLYDKAEGYHSLIIFIKDDMGNIFGGYSNEGLKCRPNKFYGNGETFLFSFYTGDDIHIFLPTGHDENYIYSDSNILCFGCSNESFSLYLKDNFLNGYSKKTETFNNPPLNININNDIENDFIITDIEMYTFQTTDS